MPKICLSASNFHFVADSRTEVRIFNQSMQNIHCQEKDRKRKKIKELLPVRPRSHKVTTSPYKLISDSPCIKK